MALPAPAPPRRARTSCRPRSASRCAPRRRHRVHPHALGRPAAAIDAVRLFTAAFDAPYGAPIGNANRLEPDEMFTIAPLPCSSIGSAARRERNQTLAKLRSTTVVPLLGRPGRDRLGRAAAGVVDQDVEAPELVHRRSTSCSHWSTSVTSVGTTSARRPSASISRAVSSSGSGRRPASTMSAPCSARTSATPARCRCPHR